MNDSIIFNVYLSKKIINNLNKNKLFETKNMNTNAENCIIKR
jgi:hypothetical protein